MLHVLHCVVLVTFAREKKEREPLFKQTLKDHVSHYHELMSRVWPVNAYFFRRHARRKVAVIKPTVVSSFGVFVFEFWVLRFRSRVLRFRDFGVFVFEFWVLRFRSRVLRFRDLGASCFGLRFRVLRFRN